MHQPACIVMCRVANNLLGRAILLDLTRVQHNDVIGDLCHARKIMRDINRRRSLLLDDRLEGLAYLDLRGNIER